MPISFNCPNCGKKFDRIRKEFLGKRIQCYCGFVLRLGTKQEAELGNLDQSVGSFEGTMIVAEEDSSESFSDTSQMTKVVDGTEEESSRAKPRQVVDDHWMTKNISLELQNDNKKKPKKEGFRADQAPTSQKPVSRSNSTVHAADLHAPLASLPPVSMPPAMPSLPPQLPQAQYRPPSWSQKKQNSAKPAVVALISSLGLFQCLVVGVISISAIASYGGAYSDWVEQGVNNNLQSNVIIRMLIGVVLLLATGGFGIFLMLSLFSAGDELAAQGLAPRKAISAQVAISAAVYLIILIAIGAMLSTVALGRGETAAPQSFVGSYWPETGPEILSTVLLISLIPAVVLFAGIFRAVDD